MKLLSQYVRDSQDDKLALSPCFKDWTNLSASPFVEGMHGALRECLIPLTVINVANSSDVNWAPLSETMCSGTPNMENI